MLNTDLYQLTMAQTYFDKDIHNEKVTFTMFTRKQPFGGKYTVFAGVNKLKEILESRFSDAEIFYLMSLKGKDGKPLFRGDFLLWLKSQDFSRLAVRSLRDGDYFQPHMPIVKVTGSLALAQILETPILQAINFSSLIATKAKRVKVAAKNKPIMEFGLRRSQGGDFGVDASMAAYIGGVDSTSNVQAGFKFGIPVAGTHAHALVMAYNNEPEAFDAFLSTNPGAATLLIDTYGVKQGIVNAIAAFKKHNILDGAVRLDSGDLLHWSRYCRNELDKAGLTSTKIVASNDLDEYKIAMLEENSAPIDSYGVGTQLVTAADQPALGGVYKIAYVTGLKVTDRAYDRSGKLPEGKREKLSEEAGKATIGGDFTVVAYGESDHILGASPYVNMAHPIEGNKVNKAVTVNVTGNPVHMVDPRVAVQTLCRTAPPTEMKLFMDIHCKP